jgi:hypothetical protein
MMRTLMAVTALFCLFGSSAEARSGHHRYRQHQHYAGRPGAWCGWYMRSQVGSDPGPNYNLARSWAQYGSNVVAHRWARSSFGGTTSARSSVRKMASGLSKAAMTATQFGRGPDLSLVQSLSETPTRVSDRGG